MSDETTATAQTTAEPAKADTAVVEPKPAQPDWEAAYKGIQRTINKRDQRIEGLVQQLEARTAPLQSGVDLLLKQQLGEEGYKDHQEAQRLGQERADALAAAKTANEYIPQSIAVIAETMRIAGVPETDIQSVFQSASDTSNVAEWATAVKIGTKAVIEKAKAQEKTTVETQARAKNQDEVKAEAEVLAEQTLRAKGIDKVDFGKGTGNADRGFVSKLKGIDRNTAEGEADFQKLMKEAKRGTLNV